MNKLGITRRQALRLGVLIPGLLTGVPSLVQSSESTIKAEPIRNPIPRSGETLPVIGVGTNNYGVSAPADIQLRREVLQYLAGIPDSVVDTAQVYGESEVVIGNILRDSGIRERLFLATKTPMRGDFSRGAEMVQRSFDRLQVDSIDLLMVHSLAGLDDLMPVLEQARGTGKVRYIGVSTSSDAQYPEIMAAMRRYPVDFLQVDYSIDNRSAALEVLPLAQEREIAVMINTPFGGRHRAASLFAKIAEQPLPDFCADIDVTSWAQLFLKYVISHPAVTVAIPGMTKVSHLKDNLGAAFGRLPDQVLRDEIERYWGRYHQGVA